MTLNIKNKSKTELDPSWVNNHLSPKTSRPGDASRTKRETSQAKT